MLLFSSVLRVGSPVRVEYGCLTKALVQFLAQVLDRLFNASGKGTWAPWILG